MFRNTHLFILLFSAVAFASCEKVIDVDIRDAEPVLVVEGTVNNRADSQVVYLRKSVVFSSPNNFPEVSNANVSVSDPFGNSIRFLETRPGFYVARSFRGRPGRTYNLKVEVEGKVYTATSTMPTVVNIDSLGVNVSTFLGEERRSILVLYTDPATVKNYYRFYLSANGKRSEEFFVFDDNFNNGRKVNRELGDFDLKIESGDFVDLEMHGIDRPIYRYWQGLDQNQNRGGASTTPANPVSNITNGALGYFSAHTMQVERIKIP